MKLVTFGRPMAPHGVGDTRLVTDEVAARLDKEGVLEASEAWPATATPAAPQKPRRPIVQPERPSGQLDLREVK